MDRKVVLQDHLNAYQQSVKELVDLIDKDELNTAYYVSKN